MRLTSDVVKEKKCFRKILDSVRRGADIELCLWRTYGIASSQVAAVRPLFHIQSTFSAMELGKETTLKYYGHACRVPAISNGAWSENISVIIGEWGA